MKVVDKAFENKLKKSVLKIESVFRKSGLGAEIFEINLETDFIAFSAKIAEAVTGSKKKMIIHQITTALNLSDDEVDIKGRNSESELVDICVASKSFN